MISFCLEEFIESKQFTRFFADLVSVQESCFVHNETVDDTYFLNPLQHTKVRFAFLQKFLRFFRRFLAFT